MTILIDFVILSILLITFFFIIQYFHHPNFKMDGVFIDPPREIPDIELLDHHGHLFTKAQLKNHWTFLAFGFTHCPMICPTTLDALNKMYLLLQKQVSPHLLPQIVFISIDPKRDTPARLNQFINTYNSNFIGVKTEIAKIKNLEMQFSISLSNMNGNITHPTDILLLNPKSQIQAYFLYPHSPQSMASDYQKILKENALTKSKNASV